MLKEFNFVTHTNNALQKKIMFAILKGITNLNKTNYLLNILSKFSKIKFYSKKFKKNKIIKKMVE